MAITVGITSVASAEIIYDPVTNTYIQEGEQLDGNNPDWIPVETTTEEATEEQESLPQAVEDVTDIVWFPVETIVDIAEPDLEDPVVTEVFEGQTVGSLQLMLEESRTELKAYLEEQTAGLENMLGTVLVNKYGEEIGELLLCLWNQNRLTQMKEEIESIIEDVDVRIDTGSADLFALISGLGYKESVDLITSTEREVEAWVLATEIEAYRLGLRAVIDYYRTSIVSDITNYANGWDRETIDDLLTTYSTRKTLLNQVEQAFRNFEEGSFFSQTVVGPRADELESLADKIFDVFVADMKSKWGNRPEDQFDAFIVTHYEDFQDAVEERIEELFPFGHVQGLYNSYDTLIQTYGTQGKYTCSTIISNRIVEEIAPQLISRIQGVQENIAIAQSAVGEPTSRMELQEGFSNELLTYYDVVMSEEFSSLRKEVKEVELTAEEKYYMTVKSQVLAFLMNMKLEYAEAGKAEVFTQKLERAEERINVSLEVADFEERMITILKAIRAAIQEAY